MSYASVFSRASQGILAPTVATETHLAPGLPQFTIVGLPATCVKESKDRVRSALIESGFEFPKKRITVNLAPADIPKEGGRFDLPIAISILLASGQIRIDNINTYEFAGELGLNGELRTIRGVLPFAVACEKAQRTLFFPDENSQECSLIENLVAYPIKNLRQLCSHFLGQELTPYKQTISSRINKHDKCYSQVVGQAHAKRALEITAAGHHSLLMNGPPGSGKTMLASRLPSILPPMQSCEALEVASIHSISHEGFKEQNFKTRPFRQPHHSSSNVALIGGGRIPKPGEVSLAHHGVLFLDELPEFDRKVLEVLREPLESGEVYLSRAQGRAQYPASFLLLAAMNPCPCGNLTSLKHACTCSPEQVQRYAGKLSGPLLDRIDMHIEVANIASEVLSKMQNNSSESSESIQQRVLEARTLQYQRQGKVNSLLTPDEINTHCKLNSSTMKILQHAIDKLGLSARAFHRILKLSRTIADMSRVKDILEEHVIEAIGYRKLDRKVS